MVWYEPLQLEYWLVNVFSGGSEIFIASSVIAIAFMAAYFKMFGYTTLILFILYAMLMSVYFRGVYFLMILIAGLAIAYVISNLVKK